MLEGELIRGSCEIWRAPGICSWASPLPALYKRPTTKCTSPGKTFCRYHGYLTVGSSGNRDTLKADLNTLQEWELVSDMEFNPSKCQVLHITRLKHALNTQYSLHGQVLEATDTAKYLGVSIAKDLSWNDHISSVTAKANRTLCFVKRNARTNNEKVKELAYKTLVRPQVEYASPVWPPHKV